LATTDWSRRGRKRGRPATFAPAGAPGLYRVRAWPRPTAPWMSRFSPDGPADTLPPYLELPQPVTGRLGSVTVTLDPNMLGRPYLERAELAVLQIIKDQVGKRPIYFSASTGNYGDRLGLGAYLVGEGLVRRVLARPAAPIDSVRLLPDRGFVNVPRTSA